MKAFVLIRQMERGEGAPATWQHSAAGMSGVTAWCSCVPSEVLWEFWLRDGTGLARLQQRRFQEKNPKYSKNVPVVII